MISGTLLIDKEIGITSRKEVNNISHRLGEKKAGHIGTLDPFADGLLIVLLGKATKISPFLEGMDKTYLATLKLGIATDSGDLDGNIILEKEVPLLDKKQIENVLLSFLGKQKQIPPMYSALKVDGKELYKYAREGKQIERKERDIEIYEIKLLNYANNEIQFIAKVSKGTYIRTLGEDIAKKLETIGHLTKLTRLAVGPYTLENAKKSKDVTVNDLISTKKMLEFMPSFEVSGELAKYALNGMHFRLPIEDKKVLLYDKDDVIAIYERNEKGVYCCIRGLR